MNRRMFLRGLGGAAVAAPFLSSIGARRPKGQTVTAPKTLIVMFTHYGCVTDKFFPVKSHGALAAADLAPNSIWPCSRRHRQASHPARDPRDERVDAIQRRHGRTGTGERRASERMRLVLHPAAGDAQRQRSVRLLPGDEVQRQARRHLAGSCRGAAAQSVGDAALHASRQYGGGQWRVAAVEHLLSQGLQRRAGGPGGYLPGPRHADGQVFSMLDGSVRAWPDDTGHLCIDARPEGHRPRQE